MNNRWHCSLALVALPVMLLAAAHPTPVVELVKKVDVLRQTLPQGNQLFVRTVRLGKEDVTRIEREAHYTPEDPDVRFYLAKDHTDEIDGVVLFTQSNTRHGPVEVGITFRPDGTVASAIVTKATVETKPWVLTTTRAGLMKEFVGMHYGSDVGAPLMQQSYAELGHMPHYMAEVIAATVARGLILHHLLYRG